MHGPAIRAEKIFFRVHLTTKTEFVTSASQRPGFVAHLTFSRLTRKTEFVTPAFAGAGVEQPPSPSNPPDMSDRGTRDIVTGKQIGRAHV